MDVLTALVGDAHSDVAIPGIQNPVTIPFQHLAAYRPHGGNVFHHENGFRASSALDRHVRGSRHWLIDTWQVDLEARPVARLRIHPDEAARLLHDSLYGGQAEARSFADVQGIVQQSGGFIWVYSEPSHGT